MWTLAGHDVGGAYNIIYADPPWSYKDKNPAGGADAQYPTMSIKDLCQMPVRKLGSSDSVLFMWATWPTLPDALALMTAWGYQYKNCGFLWAKTNKIKPTPFLGLGHWTRGNTEPCLLATRGKPHRIDAKVEQLLVTDNLVVSPLTKHSRKPPEVRDRIIQLMGDTPAVELFARETAVGWDSHGNEMSPETSVLYSPEKT
jgi:N6-adenosine-specific RNA methylase IME4